MVVITVQFQCKQSRNNLRVLVYFYLNKYQCLLKWRTIQY